VGQYFCLPEWHRVVAASIRAGTAIAMNNLPANLIGRISHYGRLNLE